MPALDRFRTLGNVLYKAWMRFALILSIVNTTILLTLIFFLLIGPIALIMLILRKDPLDRTLRKSVTFWREKQPIAHSLEEVRRQF